jgi:hypothetical protein
MLEAVACQIPDKFIDPKRKLGVQIVWKVVTTLSELTIQEARNAGYTQNELWDSSGASWDHDPSHPGRVGRLYMLNEVTFPHPELVDSVLYAFADFAEAQWLCGHFEQVILECEAEVVMHRPPMSECGGSGSGSRDFWNSGAWRIARLNIYESSVGCAWIKPLRVITHGTSAR